MGLQETLWGVPSDEYGDQHRAHVLELYRTYLEMADRISSRRETANSFFLTINTAIIGFIGYVTSSPNVSRGLDVRIPIAVAGIAICYLWHRILRSYRDLNSAKFKIVHEIEQALPLRPYDAEWEAVGRGKDPARYLPFTHIEVAVPWIFILLHLCLLLGSVLWHIRCASAAGGS